MSVNDIFTANGTVYTWGGGTEGQLGHGSKVLYLSDPRPLSHDALPRASQIACGDSYSAAVACSYFQKVFNLTK